MNEIGRLGRARARSNDARQRMRDTLASLRLRLDPQKVAKDAVEALVDQGTQVLHSGVETAKRNPAPLIGAAAFLGLFFNRKRLVGLIRRKRAPKSAKPALAPRVRSPRTRPPPPKRIAK